MSIRDPQDNADLSDEALNALLREAAPPPVSAALQEKILADYEATVVRKPQTLAGVWRALTGKPFKRSGLVLPSGLGAALCAAGFFMGAVSGGATAAYEDEALLYADAALSSSLGTTEETFLWDAE